MSPDQENQAVHAASRGLAGWFALLIATSAAAAAFAAVGFTSFGERLELSTVDARFELRGRETDAAPAVAIVAINDETDHALGRFPYPRRHYADAIKALHGAGARAVVFDVNFDFASGSTEDDRQLVTAARTNQPVVFVTGEQNFDNSRFLPAAPLQGIRFEGVAAGTAFAWSRSSYGLADVTPSADGAVRDWIVRRKPAKQESATAVHPGLALAGLQAAGVGPAGLAKLPDNILLNYTTAPRDFTQINLADVLSGRNLDRVAGRTVFIGATSQVLHDQHETPFEQAMPGVMLHAQAYENLRQSTWLTRAPSWTGALAAAVLAMLWWLCLTRCSLLSGVALAAAGSVAYAGLGYGLFVGKLTVIPLAAPLSAAGATGFSLLLCIAWTAIRERRRIASMFSRYVAPDVVKELIRRGSNDQMLVGERREITVLFADVRGFTSMSEHSDPQAVVAQLNDYLAEMTEAIYSRGGTIDKFMGDGIMALFGAPLVQPDHADRACEAARAMLARLGHLNSLRQAAGLEPLRIGIGINTGPAIIGNIGSHRRLDYTAIGDCVNLASRLESATAGRPSPVLISESTAAAASRTPSTADGAVTVRGRTQATNVFVPDWSTEITETAPSVRAA